MLLNNSLTCNVENIIFLQLCCYLTIFWTCNAETILYLQLCWCPNLKPRAWSKRDNGLSKSSWLVSEESGLWSGKNEMGSAVIIKINVGIVTVTILSKLFEISVVVPNNCNF